MDIDFKKLETLLENQRFDEFKKEVSDFLTSPISEDERDDFDIKLMSVYLDMRNRMDSAYIEHLDDCLAVLHEIDSQAKKINHESALDEARKKVSGLS